MPPAPGSQTAIDRVALPAHDPRVRRGMVLVLVGMAACGEDPAPEPHDWPDCALSPASWQSADGVVRGDVLAIVGLPDGRVMAGTSMGVFTLDVATRQWVDGVELGGPVTSLAVDPADPGRVLASARGVHESIGGAAWQTLLPDPAGGSVAFAPDRPSRVYAALGGRVLVSDDGGATWAPTGLDDDDPIQAVAVSAGKPHAVFAARGDLATLVSHDGGATWAPLEMACTAIAVAGDTIACAVSGLVFRSRDLGQTWMPTPLPIPMIDRLAVDPADPARMFAAGTERLAASFNGGDSWQFWLDYPPIGSPAAMTVAPGDGVYIAPGRGSAVLSVHDPGAAVHWYGGGVSGAGRTLGNSVDGFLYVGTSDGLFFSGHGGQSWATLGAPVWNPDATPVELSIRVAPADPAVLYAYYAVPPPSSGTEPLLFRSDDAGATWQELGISRWPPRVVDPLRPQVVYGVGDGQLQVIEGDETWRAVDLGAGEVTGVFEDTAGTGVLIAITEDGVSRIVRVLELGAERETVAELDAAPGAPVAVHATDRDVLVLLDTGALVRAGAALDPGAPLTDLVAHPSSPDVVFALAGGRVLRSDDRGASWCEQDDSLAGLTRVVAMDGLVPSLVASDGERLHRLEVAP